MRSHGHYIIKIQDRTIMGSVQILRKGVSKSSYVIL